MLISCSKRDREGYFLIKRIMDISVSAIAILLLLPLMLLIALAIKIDSPGPVLFSQSRVGLQGRIFRIFKFRSMKVIKEKNGKLLEDKERITKLGGFLRRTSLDEFPQLVNVLVGEMSLIGPRPLLPQYLKLYSSTQNRRHEVKPGITGLAQVMGRNSISWERKFQYDVEYVQSCSIKSDCLIILKTLSKVVSGEGVNESQMNTMEPFKGPRENTDE